MSHFDSTELSDASTAKADCQNLQLELRIAAASVRWRKLLLRRRWELSFIRQSFARMWRQHFPHHDCVTLQFKRTAQSRAESYWDAPSWKTAARAYHEERKFNDRQPDPKTAQLRWLLSDSVSPNAAYRELNASENRPAPQTTVQAIMWCVRERGLAALKEPANLERLLRCDAAAKAEINARIGRLVAAQEIAT